jgi:hypothetical protein
MIGSAATGSEARNLMRWGCRAVLAGYALTGSAPAGAEVAGLAERPAFSAAEEPARSPATCGTIAGQLRDLPVPETRIDLTIVGTLTLVETDGALWYLAVCAEPDVRVLCVTYGSNGMTVHDSALLRGGYNRQDATHVVLDPCLASRSGAPSD